MKMAHCMVVLTLLSLTTSSTKAHSASKSDAANLLVPGKSCGKISLGMTKQQVMTTLGKPTKTIGLGSNVVGAYYWTTPS
jgi:outer membrane protein assembly factor BamE (lipoprotein component of BamABCDE complex)